MTEVRNDVEMQIQAMSEDALAKMAAISATASASLQSASGNSSNAFANINTLTSSSAVQNLGQIDAANRESYRVLTKEPAIARVVVLDDNNCLLYTSPSPRDRTRSRMPSSA